MFALPILNHIPSCPFFIIFKTFRQVSYFIHLYRNEHDSSVKCGATW